MYDKELALEILDQIYQATQTILRRFEPIKSASVVPLLPRIRAIYCLNGASLIKS